MDLLRINSVRFISRVVDITYTACPNQPDMPISTGYTISDFGKNANKMFKIIQLNYYLI